MKNFIGIATRPTTSPALIEQITEQAKAERPKQNTLKTLKEIWDTPSGIQNRVNDRLLSTMTDPMKAELAAVVISDGDSTICIDKTDPKDLTESAVNLISNSDALICWNSDFLLSVVFNNALRFGIPVPLTFPVYNRHWHSVSNEHPIIDVMHLIPNGSPSWPNLDDVVQSLGLTAITYLKIMSESNGNETDHHETIIDSTGIKELASGLLNSNVPEDVFIEMSKAYAVARLERLTELYGRLSHQPLEMSKLQPIKQIG